MAGKPLGQAMRYFPRLFSDGTVTGLSDAQLLRRYAENGDPVAFEALVGRHGPMVLAVCRGILKDPNAAQDAFQATFLVLIRRAGSLWSIRGSLGSWLYRVARRIAIRANADAVRRRAIEARAVVRVEESTVPSDVILGLHEEIDRLPEKLRAPIVLCHLEQLSYAQAADQLGWTTSTVRGRLARGRELLRGRLVRRGVIPTMGGLATLLPERHALAAVPRSWIQTTVAAAASRATGEAVKAGIVSASAAAISEEVMRIMGIQSLMKVSAAGLIGFTALAWGVSAALIDTTNPGIEIAQAPAKPARTARSEPPPRPADDHVGIFDFRGQVLDPDGRPVQGALVYALQKPYFPPPQGGTAQIPPTLARTDREGRFKGVLDQGSSDWMPHSNDLGWRDDKILAVKPGYGLARIRAGSIGDNREATLTLAPDDVPIKGRVVDSNGGPVVGATVRVLSIDFPKPGTDLDAVLASAELPRGGFETLSISDAAPLALSAFPRTGDDGRFELRGVGRDRLAHLKIEKPGVQALEFYAMTRQSKTPRKSSPQPTPPKGEGNPRMSGRPPFELFGAEVEVRVDRSRPINGVVRAKGTGKPVAGATVNGYEPVSNTAARSITGDDGSFRLDGLPKASSYELHVLPSSGEPLLARSTTLSNGEGADPIRTTIELQPGIVIRGRLIDKQTGEQVQPLQIQYWPLPSNPNRSMNRTEGVSRRFIRKTNSFEMTVPPGKGLIAGGVENSAGRYVSAQLRKEDKGKGLGSRRDKERSMIPLEAFQAYKIVDVPTDAKDFAVELELIRGLTRRGRIVDPEGKPIQGVVCSGLEPGWGPAQILDGDQFEAKGLHPNIPRPLLFAHEGRKLTGKIELQGDPGSDPPTVLVRLHPAGIATGRLVDEKGLPLVGVRLRSHAFDFLDVRSANEPERAGPIWPRSETATSDAEGKFRLVGFFPDEESMIGLELPGGQPYLYNKALYGFKLGPGEVRDLGAVTIKMRPTDK
jgi:RNA polymerase sigma factor (sigma-70 family)